VVNVGIVVMGVVILHSLVDHPWYLRGTDCLCHPGRSVFVKNGGGTCL
jgi:hypothetical protein